MVAPFGRGTQARSEPGRHGVGRCEGVAPNAENPPALIAKQPCHEKVTGDVASDFVLPISAVGTRARCGGRLWLPTGVSGGRILPAL